MQRQKHRMIKRPRPRSECCSTSPKLFFPNFLCGFCIYRIWFWRFWWRCHWVYFCLVYPASESSKLCKFINKHIHTYFLIPISITILISTLLQLHSMIDKPDQDVSQYLVLLILVITVDRLFCLDQQDRGLQKIWDQDSGEKFLIQDVTEIRINHSLIIIRGKYWF